MTTEQEQNNKSNAASQTLFRFASLRNPQLAEAKNNDNFIVRSHLTTGYFDTLIQEWYTPPAKGLSKIDYLTQRINENTEDGIFIKTQRDLKNILGYFYDASKILSQKRNWDNIADIEEMIAQLASRVNSGLKEMKLLNPNSVESKKLWDSLVYHMLLQKDFYLKEFIIQALQVINYYQNYQAIETEENENKQLRHSKVATAKVVIPDYLFIDTAIPQNENEPFTVNETEIGGSYIYEMDALNKQSLLTKNYDLSTLNYANRYERMELAIATQKRNQLELLKKEVKKLDKDYKKHFVKSYNVAYKTYQEIVNPLWTEYENEIQEIEDTFTPEMTEAEKQEALSAVEVPVIQNFSFQKDAERDLDNLSQKLSKDSLYAFIGLFSTKEEASEVQTRVSAGEVNEANVLEYEEQTFVFPEDDYLTFNEISGLIDEKLEEVYAELKAKADLGKQQYVKLGSVLIPVNKSEETVFAYSFMAKSSYTGTFLTKSRWDFSLTLNLPDASWSIASMNYQIKTNMDVSKAGTYFSYTRIGGDIFVGSFFQNQFEISREDLPTNFEIEITFTNGEVATIILDREIISNLLYTGIFKLASDTEDEEDVQNNVFVPNGFGIKRLGVADYMKVEQSTHAYVEGEVANIENIMAREYRDKSTRRLRRTEITDSSSTETEREKLSDTTTANRYEMQTEVSKMLQEERNKEGHASVSGGKIVKFDVGGSFANHTSKETATRQAVSKSQDITARALDRIVSKVKVERIEKIIEEFEENNSHGFDNRKGDKHVVGVYRWVDKLMKNQIFNYGKRMMLEFMVPQPAKLHELALGKVSQTAAVYEKPVDPRTDAINPMRDASSATEQVIQYWADYYNVELTALPEKNILHSVGMEDNLDNSASPRLFNFTIPDNYKAYEAEITYAFYNRFKKNSAWFTFDNLRGGTVSFEGKAKESWNRGIYTAEAINIVGNYDMIYYGGNGTTNVALALKIKCTHSDVFTNSWKQEQFQKIIAAYDVALKEWEEKIASIKDEENQDEEEKAKEENAQYYRQIEEVVLKHNCIAYLLQNYAKLGTKLYTAKNNDMKNFKILLGKDLDDYTALAKFMEQAFEWEIMDYTFYPYYWANKEDWKTMFLSESIDPLFRSFLQAGMGRVIVTIKPGFEDAVNFYLATGKIWNGGEIPVIGDPLYLSVADELREPQGEKYGKSWITRIPTPLTILQAESIGLEVTSALPFTIEDSNEFENPNDLITESNFKKEIGVTMQAPDNKAIGNMEINNDYLQLTTNDTPHQIVAQLSLDDLKDALE